MENRKGFTLIELLIVVVIIGILAAIAIPKYGSVREKSFRSAMVSDLRNLAAVQEVYHSSNQTYSTNLSDLNAIVSAGITMTINEGTGQGWAATVSHAGIVAQQCGIYHGNAAATGGSPAVTAGVVACSF